MNTATVLSHFRRIGTDLRIITAAAPQGDRAYWWEPPLSPTLEATAAGTFILSLPSRRIDEFDMSVLIVKNGPSGSLALTLWSGTESNIHRFLCGSDRNDGWYAQALANVTSQNQVA